MQLETKRLQKLITFSPQLYYSVRAKAQRVGLSFPAYIRMLAAIDIKKEVESMPMVSKSAEKRISQSLRDLEEGNYVEVEPDDKDQLDKALESPLA